ncbi:hypothetical protein K2X85_14445 [bacterium]|nr:hypothetical protein [bacterium]
MSPFAKYFAVTHRTSLLIAVSFALGVGGMALAQRTAKDQVGVTALSRQDIVEKLDGKDAGAASSSSPMIASCTLATRQCHPAV